MVIAPTAEDDDMDRMTKLTLWVTFIVLAAYFIWFFRDCAMDETCRIVCGSDHPPIPWGVHGCHIAKAPQ
jgi:hypothetical protein